MDCDLNPFDLFKTFPLQVSFGEPFITVTEPNAHSLKKKKSLLGVVAHTFNPSTRVAQASRFLSLRPDGLQSEFHGYTEKPCFEEERD